MQQDWKEEIQEMFDDLRSKEKVSTNNYYGSQSLWVIKGFFVALSRHGKHRKSTFQEAEQKYRENEFVRLKDEILLNTVLLTMHFKF